jgi:hypothetical protein
MFQGFLQSLKRAFTRSMMQEGALIAINCIAIDLKFFGSG